MSIKNLYKFLGHSLEAPLVKDLASLLLWRGFDPWPGNFHMPWVWQKKESIFSGPVIDSGELDIYGAMMVRGYSVLHRVHGMGGS